MFMFVQGRVDASLMWAIEVEDFFANDLKLTVNRADPCVYSGEGPPECDVLQPRKCDISGRKYF
jgi:hypothetical protein